jgi:hypothetical protein
MTEGRSVGPKDLVLSSNKTEHFDDRMHLTLDDMKKCYDPPQVFNPTPPPLARCDK